jgi:hypothetical protein
MVGHTAGGPTWDPATTLKMTETTRGNYDTSTLSTGRPSTTMMGGTWSITTQPTAGTVYADSTTSALSTGAASKTSHLWATSEFFRDTTPTQYDAQGHSGGFGFWTPVNTAEAVLACSVVTCAACGCVAAYCVCRQRQRERERSQVDDVIEMQPV